MKIAVLSRARFLAPGAEISVVFVRGARIRGGGSVSLVAVAGLRAFISGPAAGGGVPLVGGLVK